MDKKTKDIILYVVLIVIVILVGYYLFSSPSYSSINANQANSRSAVNQSNNSVSTSSNNTNTSGQLQITDEVIGTGAVAQKGDLVTVNYIGTFLDGKKFDSSYDRHQPFQFTLGAGDVIQGWDEGVIGMRVGGKRKLVIPPSLAYGSAGAGGVIPPNATLVFEIDLLKVQAQAPQPQ